MTCLTAATPFPCHDSGAVISDCLFDENTTNFDKIMPVLRKHHKTSHRVRNSNNVALEAQHNARSFAGRKHGF